MAAYLDTASRTVLVLISLYRAGSDVRFRALDPADPGQFRTVLGCDREKPVADTSGKTGEKVGLIGVVGLLNQRDGLFNMTLLNFERGRGH